MSSIGDLFGFPGQEAENPTPFDPATLDAQLDNILATRPVAGAPEGYVSPARPSAPAQEGVAGAAGGTPGSPASVAPETPGAPPPFAWPPGPASAYPPAAPPAAPPAPAAPAPAPAPGQVPAAPAPAPSWWEQLSPMEQQELMLTHQALRDPDRQGAVRRAYIGGTEPAAPPAVPSAPPVATPPAPPQLPDGIEENTPEAAMFYRQAETERQLAEIREQVAQRDQQTERQLELAAAQTAVQGFAARYGDRLTREEMAWVAQTAGYQRLPDAFRQANPNLSREEAMNQALEFQLRSTDSLLAKIVSPAPPAPATAPPGAPPATPPGAPPPVVHPGQTPLADARHRYLTALSSAASPSGEFVTRQPLQHRPDGKLDEPSRMELVRQMTSGGAMGELMGPT